MIAAFWECQNVMADTCKYWTTGWIAWKMNVVTEKALVREVHSSYSILHHPCPNLPPLLCLMYSHSFTTALSLSSVLLRLSIFVSFSYFLILFSFTSRPEFFCASKCSDLSFFLLFSCSPFIYRPFTLSLSFQFSCFCFPSFPLLLSLIYLPNSSFVT